MIAGATGRSKPRQQRCRGGPSQCRPRQGEQSQFGRRLDYGRARSITEMSLAMIRFASFPVTAFAVMFTAAAAYAQASPSDPADLLTRITRLQETIRNLTG